MRGAGVRGAEVLNLLVMTGVAIVIGLFLFGDRNYPLERSAIGSRGLVAWLREAGIESRHAGYRPVTRDEIGLRILPVLDTDPGRPFTRPADDPAFLRTGTERDIPADVLARKARLLPTLLIAPKWTRAMRHSGLADPSLRLPSAEAAAPLRPFGLFSGPLIRPDARLMEFRHGAAPHRGLLYAPQLFPPALAPHCRGVVSPPGGHLLIACASEPGPPLYALSDPDLLNNHGLALADNAAIAASVIAELAGGGPVLVDDTDYIFTVQSPPPSPARDWRDLLRIFAYPFSLAWVGLGLLSVLLLWRSWVRFGPPRRIDADRLGASRATSIAAKARLLRMAGSDPQLIERHVRNRLRRIEQRLFGHMAPGDPVTRIVAFLERRDPILAAGFASAVTAATTAGSGGAGQMTAMLDEFELQAKRVVDGPR